MPVFEVADIPTAVPLLIGGTTPVSIPLEVGIPGATAAPIFGSVPLDMFGTKGWEIGATWESKDWLESIGWGCTKGWAATIGATLGGSGLAGIFIKALFGSGGIAGGVVVLSDAKREGGKPLGTSYPLSLRLISLQAIENSLMSILPSASVSAKALKILK